MPSNCQTQQKQKCYHFCLNLLWSISKHLWLYLLPNIPDSEKVSIWPRFTLKFTFYLILLQWCKLFPVKICSLILFSPHTCFSLIYLCIVWMVVNLNNPLFHVRIWSYCSPGMTIPGQGCSHSLQYILLHRSCLIQIHTCSAKSCMAQFLRQITQGNKEECWTDIVCPPGGVQPLRELGYHDVLGHELYHVGHHQVESQCIGYELPPSQKLLHH